MEDTVCNPFPQPLLGTYECRFREQGIGLRLRQYDLLNLIDILMKVDGEVGGEHGHIL